MISDGSFPTDPAVHSFFSLLGVLTTGQPRKRTQRTQGGQAAPDPLPPVEP